MSLRTVQFVFAIATVAALSAAPAAAQYVGQAGKQDKKPEMRAVAVLEWTGDEQHPTRSRIIPVSVFDGQELQDAGIYLARPQPLALDPEVEYQLKEDGKNTGLYIVMNASEEQGSWVGYGKWQDLPKPRPAKPAIVHDWKEDDSASNQPVLHRKHHDDAGSSGSDSGSGNPSTPPDPDRPTLHKAPGSGSGSDSGSNAGTGPAPDPDRPTLHKSPDSGSDSSSASAGSGAEDPDRPRLTKKQQTDEEPSVSSVENSGDPNRPRLKRGKSSYSGGEVLPSLTGVPPDMHQAVAVSDARNTPDHPWDYSWANPDDERKYKGQLEDLARTALGLTPPASPAPRKTTTKTGTTHKSQKTTSPAPPPALLDDEQFRVFELAYGSGATMVLSAHTGGTGADEKFVTLVAQPDLYGNMAVLLKNVTDGAHLDSNPRLRLIDAVDAMADNRGELLFELRGQTQRQFALYRVLRGQVTKLFVSGGSDSSEASN
ncbi:MAG TPA: hypothetical protein VL986_08140 [Terracidiphilus sp.]|nr:hypothetical protein [Terracidiphilus sp.]